MKKGRFFAALVVGVMFFAFSTYATEITIGTGTLTWTYPLSTNYHDARTQVIYLASELDGSKTLTSLALYVSSVPGQTMNNFTIRLKHTDLSGYGSSPVWESSEWTTVYQANQTISTTGWITFIFTNQFVYNGTQNLMVDISFNNSSYTSYGYCRYTSTSTNRSIYYRTNSSYGDPLTWSNRTPIPNVKTYFPNIRLAYLIYVPNVTGMTQSAAQTAITSADLVVGSITQSFSDTIPAGSIISQLPVGGIFVEAGSAVNLVVSLGPAMQVPDIVGEDQITAQGQITSANLTIGSISYTLNDTIQSGNVISQSPVGGQSVPSGTPVNFVVSLGEKYSGSGTPEDPYQIWTAEHMNGIGTISADWNKCFKLMADIDMSIYTGEQYNIIGNSTTNFIGVFEGNTHTISNLTISASAQSYVGLFGWVGSSGQIKNLGVANVNIQAKDYVGGLVGYNYGSISDCYMNGYVSGTGGSIGGLVGQHSYGIISNCSASGSIAGGIDIGGLVGSNSGLIISCYAICTVAGTGYHADAGGLVGKNYYGSIITCYASGVVYGNNNVGGLVGYNFNSISFSYATSSVIGGGSYIGGLVGRECGAVKSCYAMGPVSGTSYVGGLEGINSGIISCCYSMGSVTGTSYIGGLVGENTGSTTSCYSTGVVSGNTYTGGLAGYSASNSISACFWDIQTSGITNSAGGTGKTTTEMKTFSTFILEGWDYSPIQFDGDAQDWIIESEGVNYPKLKFEIPSLPQYHGGSGTAEDPYQIAEEDDIFLLSDDMANWDKQFILTNDIDMNDLVVSTALVASGNIQNNSSWYIRAFMGTAFTGTFNGNGYKISNFTINGGDKQCLGLFGCIGSGGQIKNLGLENVTITGSSLVGCLVGWNNGSISYCYSTGSVRGIDEYTGGHDDCAGGLIGSNNGNINNCYSACDVNGCECVGGLVGSSSDGNIINCHSTGTVSGSSDPVGGLIGWNGSPVNYCYSTGAVIGASVTGGLIGCNLGSITDSFSTSMVSGSSTSCGIGGLIGYNEFGEINRCYATGTISGANHVGGLVGDNDGNVNYCYSTGSVTGYSSYVGGLVGYNISGTINQSYATGNTSSVSYAGGLAGYNDNSISYCYSTGNVSASDFTGGLVGDTSSYGSAISSFWDIETSGQITSEGGTGKTAAEMMTLSTFTSVGWDFTDETANGTDDIWSICETTNYPRLTWQIPDGDWECPDGVGMEDLSAMTSCWLETTQAKADINNDDNVDFGDILLISQNWLLSECGECNDSDITGDAKVDGLDLTEIIEGWLFQENTGCRRGDLNEDGGVDLADYAVLAEHWLEGI